MEVPRLNSPSDHPRKDAKSERVQLILAAALEEFVELGFAAARLDSIAERAGCGGRERHGLSLLRK